MRYDEKYTGPPPWLPRVRESWLPRLRRPALAELREEDVVERLAPLTADDKDGQPYRIPTGNIGRVLRYRKD